MKIKDLKNIWLTGVYVLFLIMVFVLFAIIRNHSNIPGGAYILLFVIIILASLIYYRAFNQNTNRITGLLSDTETISEEQAEEKKGKTDTEEIADEEEIDIKKLLPQEKANPERFGEEILQNLASVLQISQGLFYTKDAEDEVFKCVGQYAYFSDKPPVSFKLGETLPGQAVKNKNIVTLADIPEKYMTIASGLGESSPHYLTFVPILYKDEVIGLIEFASFKAVSEAVRKALKQLAEKIGDTVIKMIKK